MTVILGAIADDYTGATDLANTLVKQGMRTVQLIGVPDEATDVGDAEAVVIALKSRTAPVADAVAQSLAGLEWLRQNGAIQIMFKYCSTFDSTPEGNIGPVADALREALGAGLAFVCPAFPQNGRTIYNGHLFVGEALLSDSSMRNHPLTPMKDASLIRLMDAQSSGRTGLVSLQTVHRGASAVVETLDRLEEDGYAYAVTDAVEDDDLRVLAEAAQGHALVTGGSGIALGLPDNYRRNGLLGEAAEPQLPRSRGRSLVVAGSCSEATRAQIESARADWPQRQVTVDEIASNETLVADCVTWALEQNAELPVLIYASASPDGVAAAQKVYGVERAGQMVEECLSSITVRLADRGFDRIVVAGGETSGAVVSALGVTALRIGPEIDPGVPWTESLGERPLALALKSGNFGGINFFAKALGMLS